MVHIRTPDFSATCGWAGCTFGPWAGDGIFDQPVPLEVTRFRLEAGAHVGRIRLGGTEAMIYVIAGSGTALAPPGGGERFALGPESVLWLGGCEELSCDAGQDGLDLLVRGDNRPGRGLRLSRYAKSSPLPNCRTWCRPGTPGTGSTW